MGAIKLMKSVLSKEDARQAAPVIVKTKRLIVFPDVRAELDKVEKEVVARGGKITKKFRAERCSSLFYSIKGENYRILIESSKP